MIRNINRRILVIDFGSQYTQLLVRRIKEIGIDCESFSWEISNFEFHTFNPIGIILSGSPESASHKDCLKIPDFLFSTKVPMLGICYGMQIMLKQMGGKILKNTNQEFGHVRLKIHGDSKLLKDVQDDVDRFGSIFLDVWMSHSDQVIRIPNGFISIASTKNCPFAVVMNEKRKLYGVQFHPEVSHTNKGNQILKNFLFDICHCNPICSDRRSIVPDIVSYIRNQIGRTEKVILGISGGIDSIVSAILLNKAIGKQLICLFIDNGLLHIEQTRKILRKIENDYDIEIIQVSEEKKFFSALQGVLNPEEKRKIIGKTFVDIFYKQSRRFQNVKWLAQGTIYPDLVESNIFFKRKNLIKSHHNVGGLPEKMKLKLIEPLKSLFKDEVRKIGIELGLPDHIVHQHPFPGPGLGVRILGEVKKKYCDILRNVDSIFIEELQNSNLYYRVGQAFAVFLPFRSVGIMGDNRKYEGVISLRAVETVDFMTANWFFLPHDLLSKISNRITNEVQGVSRVVYDISNKPPSTIEWE